MDERHIFLIYLHTLMFTIAGSTLTCAGDLTTFIERENKNENIFSDNSSNFVRVNNTHYKVCQCDVKPCLKKCCSSGHVMVNDTCEDTLKEMAGSEAEILPKSNLTEYHLLYGNGCNINYFTRFSPDDYSNVKYHLNGNGVMSIFFDNESRQIQDFCLERIFNPEYNSSKLLICIPKTFPPSSYEFPVGMALSLPFLAITVIVYSFRELRNIHGKNLISHVGSLLTAYLSVIFVEVMKSSIPESLCIFLGVVRQFSFLSSFFWLNVMCFDLWWTLSNRSIFKAHSREREKKKFLMYSICGWGCPAVIVFVTIVMEIITTSESIIKPGIGLPSCFLRDGRPFFAYFYGPVIFIFCVDVTLIILSAVRFITVAKKLKSASIEDKIFIQSTRTRYFLVLKIFLMMSINWIIDPFSWIFESSFWTWFFIHSSITIQAVSIFFIFVWKTEVKRVILSKFCDGSYRELTSISVLDSSPKFSNDTVKSPNVTQNTTVC